MKLKEVFDHLMYGEFSQLSLGGANQGVIDATNEVRVATHVSLGLTALFRRFNLKERRITFALDPDLDTYVLQAGDLLKIERVLTDKGKELPLNVNGEDYACFTPSMLSLRLTPKLVEQGADTPDCFRTSNLEVVYRADHPNLFTDGTVDPDTLELELPRSHLEALLYFVATRVHGNTGQSVETNIGNPWFAKYEAECQRLEGAGFRVQTVEEDTRFRDRGWA